MPGENSGWLALLRAIPRYPHIAKANLTVAFYVGAMRKNLDEYVVPWAAARNELRELLVQIVSHAPEGEAARVMRCIEIGQPVITFQEPDYTILAHRLLESEDGRVTLIADPEFAGDKQVTIDQLCDTLIREIGEAICQARFSYRTGGYHPFDGKERDFIRDTTA